VPPVPRFVLVHGFARSYRRHRATCWGPTAPSRRQVQRQGRVDVVVEAAPEAVGDVVRDPTRVGEWSHECVGADWLGGATSAVPGARFRGRNPPPRPQRGAHRRPPPPRRPRRRPPPRPVLTDRLTPRPATRRRTTPPSR
jgi:hypothetical protein